MAPSTHRPTHRAFRRPAPSRLQTLRRAVDRVDARLLQLLNRRLRLARAIGAVKRQAGNRRVDLHREREILMHLRHRNRGPLTTQKLRAIYRQIFLTTRAVQQRTSPPWSHR